MAARDPFDAAFGGPDPFDAAFGPINQETRREFGRGNGIAPKSAALQTLEAAPKPVGESATKTQRQQYELDRKSYDRQAAHVGQDAARTTHRLQDSVRHDAEVAAAAEDARFAEQSKEAQRLAGGGAAFAEIAPETHAKNLAENPDADTWSERIRKSVGQNWAGFEQQMAGAVRYGAENAVDAAAFMSPGAGAIAQAAKPFVAQAAQPLVQATEHVQRAAQADIEANAYKFGSKGDQYLQQITDSLVQMVPTVAAAYLTKGETLEAEAASGRGLIGRFMQRFGSELKDQAPGLSVLGAQQGAQQYGESRAAGRTVGQSNADGLVFALAEAIPEATPLGAMMKPGGKFLPHLLKTAGMEGLSEVVTQAVEDGYSAGVIGKDMTWGQALQNMVDAGIVGFGMGAGMGGAGHAIHAARGGDAGEMIRQMRDSEFSTSASEEAARQFDPNRGFRPVQARGVIEAATEQSQATPEDLASPLAKVVDLGAAKTLLAGAHGKLGADTILDRNNAPATGSMVELMGKRWTVEDAFTDDGGEDGVTLSREGQKQKVYFSDLRDAGHALTPIADPRGALDQAVAAAAPGVDLPAPPVSGRPAAAPQPVSGRDQLKARIRRVENNTGDPNAKNPNSSASGTYQFTDATFDAYYRKVYGAAPPAGVKNDPAVQERLMDAMTSENEARLKKAGFDATAGHLYLAHFAGPQGALNLLRNPNGSAAALLGPKATAANKSIVEGKTAAEVIAWADHKMGGPVTSPTSLGTPRFADGTAAEPETDDGFDFLHDKLLPDSPASTQALPERQDQGLITEPTLDDGKGDGSRAAPRTVETAADLALVAPRVNAEPTPAQAEAMNYRAAHIKLQGLDITIENPKGSTRRGVDQNGQPWSVELPDHYGKIKRTVGSDDEQVDVYIGPQPSSNRVYIVDQVDADSKAHDEHKVMLGYASEAEARSAYHDAFSDGRGPERIGAVTPTTTDGLKEWLKGDTKRPAAETVPLDSRVQTVTSQGDETRPIQDAGISGLDGNEGALPESEKRGVPVLRGSGDIGSPGMDQRLPGVSSGSGAEADTGAYAGEGGQRPQLRAGESPLGDAPGAESQQAGSEQDSFGRPNAASVGLGRRDGADTADYSVSSEEGAIGAGDAQSGASSQRAAGANADAERGNSVSAGVGEAPGDQTDNGSGSAGTRLDTGAGADDSGSVATFTTAKGSTYAVHPDGTTTRDKAFRPEHGEAEQGPQPRSERTFYVAPEHVQALGEIQAQGGDPMAVVVDGNSAALKYTAGKDEGKIERRSVVPISDQPSVGAIPVETWKGGARVHFGNAITEVRQDDTTGSVASVPAESQAPFDTAPHVEKLQNYIRQSSGTLNDIGKIAKHLGLPVEQAHAVMGAVASRPNAGFRMTKGRPAVYRKVDAGGGRTRRVLVTKAVPPRYVRDTQRKTPLSAMEFVRKLGGITDPRHDLRNVGALKNHIGVLTKAGRPVDEVGRALHEAGYFPNKDPSDPHQRPTVDETIQFLADHSQGKRKDSAPEDQAPSEDDARAAVAEEIKTAVRESAGLLPSAISNTDREAIIDAMLASGDDAASSVYSYFEHQFASTVSDIRDESSDADYDIPFDIGAPDEALRDSESGGAEAAQSGERSPAEAGDAGEGRPAGADSRADGGAEPGQVDAFGTREGDQRRALEQKGEGRKQSDKAQKAPGSDGGLFDSGSHQSNDLFAAPATAATPIGQAKAALQQAMAALDAAEKLDDAALNKPASDRGAGDTQLLRDTAVSPTFRAEGLGGFDVPTQAAVLKQVFAAAQDDKVFDSIVSLIPVPVMDILAARELTPEVLLHDEAMLVNLPATLRDGDAPIPALGVDVPSALVKAAATAVAEQRAASADATGELVDGRSALGASGERQGGSPDRASIPIPENRPPAKRQVIRKPQLSLAGSGEEVFYSALERAVEASPTKRASAQQWAATLGKTPGVKREELEWSGIFDFLDMQTGPVDREALLGVIRDGGIKVEEVTLGEDKSAEIEARAQQLYEEALQDERDQWESRYGDDFDSGVAVEEGEDEDGNPVWTVDGEEFTDEGEAYDRQSELEIQAQGEAADDYAQNSNINYAQIEAQARDELRPETQFQDWSSDPSNPTYRELLITLPRGQGGNPSRAPSTHWDTDAVVAHARFMEKTDAEGRRVLFVEEVQSDWHQKGRDEGYETPISTEEMDRRDAALKAAETKFLKAAADFEAAARAAGARIPPHVGSETVELAEGLATNYYPGPIKDVALAERVRDADDALAEARLKFVEARQTASRRTEGTIPEAPFKTTWPALVMKRMIRHAVDNGYDAIAWTTGAEQSERYNLSQATGKITAANNYGGGPRFKVKTYTQQGMELLAREGMAEYTGDPNWLAMSEAQLKEAFGGDIAQRIIDGVNEKGTVELDGDDLRVGGQGMRQFYDRNLVNITNDIVKKYGAKVGTVNVPTGRGLQNEQILLENDERKLAADRATLERMTRTLGEPSPMWERDIAALEKQIEQRRAKIERLKEDPHPGLTLTPALKEAAAGGFPLFQHGETEITAKNVGRIQERLKVTMDRLGIADRVLLRTVDRMADDPRAQGSYWRRVITVAMSSPDAMFTLNHEAVHALRALNVILPDEWAALVKAARADPALWASIQRRYAGRNLNTLQMEEEAVADLFGKWASERSAKGFVGKAFQRITDLLKAIIAAFDRMATGNIQPGQVFRNIESGKIGRRPTGAGTRARAAMPTEPAMSRGDVTETPEFKRWFGDSKVVDAEGKPLVVYHGTDANFEAFDGARRGDNTSHPGSGLGFFFSAKRDTADRYSEIAASGSYGKREPTGEPRVVAAYLALKNPKRYATASEFYAEADRRGGKDAEWRDDLIAQGYDGIIVRDDHEEIVAFEPSQIKSVDNRGTFDPEDDRILYSVGDEPRPTRGLSRYQFRDPDVEVAYLTSQEFGPAKPKGMKPAAYDLFARKVMLDDIAQNGDMENLPYGLHEIGFLAAKKRVDDAVSGNPQVERAVQRYYQAQALAEAAEGINPEDIRRQREEDKEAFKAANIRLDKIEGTSEIRDALKAAADGMADFKDARRGVVSHGETQRLANELDMSVEQLMARRNGQAFNAHELLAARAMLVASADNLVELAAKADGGSDADLVAFRKAWIRHVAIQEQVSGMTAEAGRALNQFKLLARSGADLNARMMKEILESQGGRDDMEKIAKSIFGFASDPARLNRFARGAFKPTWRDKLFELWINGLLSGPATHVVNAVSNTATAVGQIPEYGLASAIGKVRSLARPDTDRILRSEVGARAVALLYGTREAAKLAADALRTGEGSDVMSKIEARTQRAISGRKGDIIRIPSRLLIASDEFYKGVARRMELAALASKAATNEGLTGEAHKARMAALVADPTDEMLEKAMDFARYSTFQTPLGEQGRAISNFINKVPGMRLIVPFMRTPANIFKFALARTPAAPILKEVRDDLKAGGSRGDLAIARIIMGSGVMALAMSLVAAGVLSGADPDDQDAKRLLRAKGWQPYSLKIGDTWYSYQRLDPIATVLGLAADLMGQHENMSESEREKAVGNIFKAILNQLKNKTFLSGIGDIIEAIQDPDRFGTAWAGRMAGTMIPTGVAQLTNALDPTVHDIRGIKDRLMSRIPGLSDNLMPKRDIWGRVITREGGVGPDVASPFWTAKDQHDQVAAELLRAGVNLDVPGRKIAKIELTPQQYDAYQEMAGRFLRNGATRLVESGRWERADDEKKAKLFDHLKDGARKAARERLGLTKRRLERQAA